MIIRTVLSLWLVLFLFSGGVRGQVFSDSKVRSFKVTEKSTVDIQNKYGKVHVITWDKDSVRFEADLRISANSYQKMDKLRKNINFEFTTTKYYVVAKTVFSNQNGIISDFVDAFIPSNQVTINYMVYIPKYVSLKIENKFGDIYMDDFNGELEIDLSNGDLKANRLSGKPTIHLSSGDGTINSISNGTVSVSYSDLEIRESNKLFLETKSSRISMDKTNQLDIDSKRDKFEIVEVGELSVKGYFSSFNIENLKKELRCSSKYGSVEVEDVSENFSFINIDSEYTDIDLFFKQGTSYVLDISHHRDTYMNLPSRLAKIETRVIDEEEKTMLTYGQIGAASSETSRKVNISALKKCNINIIHR